MVIANPVEDNELFTRIFDEVYDQYQKGHLTADIDQWSAKLALAIPEQETAKKPATSTCKGIAETAETVNQSGIVTSEQSVAQTLNEAFDLT